LGKVKLGIIGMGVMGRAHAANAAKLENTELAAVCDMHEETARKYGEQHGCRWFADAGEMLAAKLCEAVLIATPHYSHTTIGIEALKRGYHVLVEKPISVHKADAQRLIAAHKNKGQVFAAIFNQRTRGIYRKLKSMITTGELGEIHRVSWVITNWFRTDS